MQEAIKSRLKQAIITGGLETASILQSLGLMQRAGGLGVIFTLHHVRPYQPKSFEPNRHLEITPDFLDLAIRQLKGEGYVFLPLDAVPERMEREGTQPRFAAFTLDDGNRNNLEFALPVFARHDVPFTIFVTQGLSERTHGMWWETLDDLLGRLDRLTFDFGSGDESFDLRQPDMRQKIYGRFADYVHGSDEALAVAAIDELARKHGLEPLNIARSLIMDQEELAQVARHPLASLGAHTVSHRAVGRLTEAEAAAEMALSANYVAIITGEQPKAIAFPYGTNAAASPREARLVSELGFAIGLSTRPGVVRSGMPTTLLPRLSLNGFYQKARYASALASGIPMRLMGQKG
ncbi:polysaccharide deacetylase family protein [Rhizobium sp. BK376]|uniref:polysaccharide deacetylase family protein n=1 Tax=Rhizobium sp. BK376 TaxID=2512149 RepID=UPI00104E7E66|nr:polysaccharide deacetylase family protein [Rhizobium sp. BK376]TCR93458.1 polysaccharide deacetylase [Rhizobium sp. BK376]